MEEKVRFVDIILKALDEEGLLDHFMVVGSWCVYFYTHKFKETFNPPRWKTMDIEFDTSFLKRASKKIDIAKLLSKFGFLLRFHGDEGYTSFEHPDLIIEFLVPQVGDGETNPYKIPGFGINPQPVRFLSLLEEEIITVEYKGMTIKLPEPAHYALHKLIVSTERTKPEKIEKDRQQALALWDMLKATGEEEKIRQVFSRLSLKQQKLIQKALTAIGEKHRLERFRV